MTNEECLNMLLSYSIPVYFWNDVKVFEFSLGYKQKIVITVKCKGDLKYEVISSEYRNE